MPTSKTNLSQARRIAGTVAATTVEDPVEYVYVSQLSLITHREVGIDTKSWHHALKNTLRQAPDVILIGEIRDAETMEHAIAFAETGHLCLGTLHANSASQTIERIINFFPEERRKQLLMDLSANLRGIVSQRLVRREDGKGRSAAIEILLNTPTIAEKIFLGDFHEIKGIMGKSRELGMCTFDAALFDLYDAGAIAFEEAIRNADSANELRLNIKLKSKRGEPKATDFGGLELNPVTQPAELEERKKEAQRLPRREGAGREEAPGRLGRQDELNSRRDAAAPQRGTALARGRLFADDHAMSPRSLIRLLAASLLTFGALAQAAPALAFDLQAHRGGRGLKPENTLVSFENALRMGVTTLELDIAITADGVAVISHEPALFPGTARDAEGRWLKETGPLIKSLTLAQLQRYDVGRLNPEHAYGRGFAAQQAQDGTRIPTLASLFALVKSLGADAVQFDIETKVFPIGPTTPSRRNRSCRRCWP